jgi:hypothetical protein
MTARLAGWWRGAVFAVAAVALIAAAPPQGTPEQRPDAALIDRLGDDDFDARERAQTELKRIGKPAVALLVEAVRSTNDLEIRHRARKLLGDIDPGAMARERLRSRRLRLTQEISKTEGVDAVAWGESIANPFTNLTEEGKKSLRREGVDVERLLKMRARLIAGDYAGARSKSFVNRDPDTILVFGKGFVTHGEVHSVGPVLAVEDAHYHCNSIVRGADLVWFVASSSPCRWTSGAPLVVAPTVSIDPMNPPYGDILHGDFGWRAPKDLYKLLLAATKSDPAMTKELAAARKKLTAQIKKVRGVDVKDHAKAVANPFTNLTEEGTKRLKARGLDMERIVRLKKALYLTGDYFTSSKTFVNSDLDTILILGKDFSTTWPIYSLGPVLAVENAQPISEVTGADVVWFVDNSFPCRLTTGAPVILAPSAKFSLMKEGSKHVWRGDYGWRRPKDWPAAAKKE